MFNSIWQLVINIGINLFPIQVGLIEHFHDFDYESTFNKNTKYFRRIVYDQCKSLFYKNISQTVFHQQVVSSYKVNFTVGLQKNATNWNTLHQAGN